MLVQKGGISRQIDERRLSEYCGKGFAPCGEERNETKRRKGEGLKKEKKE